MWDRLTNLTPQLFSAIAAVGSFATAVLMYCMHRFNTIESVRPEIRIDDWGAKRDETHINITFNGIENVGKGPARHITFGAEPRLLKPGEPLHGTGAAICPVRSISFLGVNEKKKIEGSCIYYWKPEDYHLGQIPSALIDILIYYWDLRGNRYRLSIRLWLVGSPLAGMAVVPGTDFTGEDLAPGVICTQHRVAHAGRWKIVWERRKEMYWTAKAKLKRRGEWLKRKRHK